MLLDELYHWFKFNFKNIFGSKLFVFSQTKVKNEIWIKNMFQMGILPKIPIRTKSTTFWGRADLQNTFLLDFSKTASATYLYFT